MNLIMLLPTFLILMDEGAYLIITLVFITLNFYVQINRNLGTIKSPMFIYFIALISNYFYFRSGHRP